MSVRVAARGPLVALVLASALWGGAISGTKYALGGFDPVTLLCVELVVATAALWFVLLLRGYRPPAAWWLPAILGLLEPGLAYLGSTLGLSRTSAVHGAIISGLESTLVVVLAAVLLGEGVSRAAVVSIALALGGLVVLTGGGVSGGVATGDLLVVGGVLSASIYSVVAKRFNDGSDVLSLTTWQFSAAMVVSLSIGGLRWLAGMERPPVGVAPRYWIVAVLVGVGGFAASFLLYNRVISIVNAGWAALILNLIPVFGLLGAVIFLGEIPTVRAGMGAALIGVSVAYFGGVGPRGHRSATVLGLPREQIRARGVTWTKLAGSSPWLWRCSWWQLPARAAKRARRPPPPRRPPQPAEAGQRPPRPAAPPIPRLTSE